MIYLLSTQALLDMLTDTPAITAWRKTVPAHAIEISAVSIGEAVEIIDAISESPRRTALHAALNVVLAVADSYQGIVTFDGNAARIWAGLQAMDLQARSPDGALDELSVTGRMVLATCLSRNATLVEEPQPYHCKVNLQSVSP